MTLFRYVFLRGEVQGCFFASFLEFVRRSLWGSVTRCFRPITRLGRITAVVNGENGPGAIWEKEAQARGGAFFHQLKAIGSRKGRKADSPMVAKKLSLCREHRERIQGRLLANEGFAGNP